jgi:predicted exporter
MALEPFPLLRQTGIFIVLALGWELLASLFFLPSLLALWSRRQGVPQEASSNDPMTLIQKEANP